MFKIFKYLFNKNKFLLGLHKYNLDIYNQFMNLFDALPLCAIIKTKNIGNFFCVHGGLSPDIKTVFKTIFFFI